MHSWNNSICKTIFKNKNGFLRSGWTILIVMLLYYALLYFASFLVLTALIVLLTATGDLNRAADYFSPLANWVNDACVPANICECKSVWMVEGSYFIVVQRYGRGGSMLLYRKAVGA